MLKQVSVAFAATTLIAVAAAGCASPEAIPEERGETASNIGGSEGIAGLERACGRYRVQNPACSAESFVVQLAKKAKGDVVGAIGAIDDARTCIGNLASIGAVSTAAGPFAPVVAVGASVIKGIETISACASFAMYLSDIGIIDNVSCYFTPMSAAAGWEECKCTYACTKQQSYEFGYLDRTGWCQCTDDAAEAGQD